MKRLLYKTLFVCLFSCASLFAQKKTLYNTEFEVKKAKTLKLVVKRIPLKIIESLDDRIYLDFSMEFKNHSEKEINSYRKQIEIKKEIVGNTINLTIESSKRILPVESKLSDGFELTIPFLGWKELKKENGKRKKKDEIISQILTQELRGLVFGVELLKAIKKDKKAQVREAHFILRVPKHLKFKIAARESFLIVEGLKMNEAVINITNGNFQGNSMVNSTLDLKEGALNVVEFEGGNIKLLNASKSLIGSIKKTHLEIESSEIEIGEIGEKVTIQDYDSELFLYNFSSGFKNFKLTGEYSKIHFYQPIEDYSMTVFGNDTTFYMDEQTIVSQPSKENKSFKMMYKRPNNEKSFSGKIKFDIMHSIFYFPTATTINK